MHSMTHIHCYLVKGRRNDKFAGSQRFRACHACVRFAISIRDLTSQLRFLHLQLVRDCCDRRLASSLPTWVTCVPSTLIWQEQA